MTSTSCSVSMKLLTGRCGSPFTTLMNTVTFSNILKVNNSHRSFNRAENFNPELSSENCEVYCFAETLS